MKEIQNIKNTTNRAQYEIIEKFTAIIILCFRGNFLIKVKRG